MTTLEEFKETCRKVALLFPCGIDRVSDEQYLDAHRKEVGEALHALPALIAVAEKLYGALNDIAVEMDLPRHLQADQKIALAAFEAWKLNIEGERL